VGRALSPQLVISWCVMGADLFREVLGSWILQIRAAFPFRVLKDWLAAKHCPPRLLFVSVICALRVEPCEWLVHCCAFGFSWFLGLYIELGV
jgi:hypothetical protein